MIAARRLVIFAGLCAALAAFWWAPAMLSAADLGTLAFAAQIGGTLLAALCCFFAAYRSTGSDRLAWACFGIGMLLYFGGNSLYAYYGAAGIDTTFPSLPEASYFVLALIFVLGMFQYGKLRQRSSRVQLYNFILVYCALTLAVLFLLHDAISASTLSPFGTVVALLYPALWFSVAAFGVMSLILSDQGAKTFPFALLLTAVIAEALADFIYAQQQLRGLYELGGITQLLWVASSALIVWAAFEQIAVPRDVANRETTRRSRGRSIAQAAVPAVAMAIILVSGMVSGALSHGNYVGFAITLALIFAVVTGFREHWIIDTQRQLRGAVENSRAALARSREQLSGVVESTSDSVIVVDRNWTIEFFNRRAAASVGHSVALRLGASLWDLFPTEVNTEPTRLYHWAMATQQPIEIEECFGGIWFEIHAFPTNDGLSIFFRDISERRRIREEMAHMARHDPLTNLANRSLFNQRLAEAAVSGEGSATLLLDLDHFKEVNDSLGHPMGDRLLAGTADRLREALRPRDTIARLGGDEFAIILTGGPSAEEVTGLARRILALAGNPHEIDGESIKVGASLGIALSDGIDGDADQILRAADIALYAAKSEARGTFRIFEQSMQTDLLRRQALRSDLAAAFERGELEVAYQPLIDLHTDRVCGFEALLRWRHRIHGMVSPEVFVPIAEETGLIGPIGDWVLRTACAEAATWPAGISVAVNLSSRQFRGDLAEQIEAALLATGLAKERLELEITESVLLDDTRANMATLLKLRDLGIRIALDDFGTGYSSLGYLQRFPFSKVKIDRSFISGLPANGESQAIVKMVIGLCKALNMRITAEGVETQAQLEWVKRGCDEAQGYLLSRPVSAGEIPALIERLGAPAEANLEAVRIAS